MHGGTALKSAMLRQLAKFSTFREAEPGEFTKRALLNNKLDLLQAEAVNDLINSESELQVALSINQLGGHHSRVYSRLRTRLIKMLAHCEAFIDFEAEETSDPRLSDVFVQLTEEAAELLAEIGGYLDQATTAETIREGFKISIVGPPNAGKSTLMNLLSQRKTSIVSDVPGTTRDLITTSLNLLGFNVILTDTAGLREASDQIEHEGIEMAKQELHNSNAVILVLDLPTLKKTGESQYLLEDPVLVDQLSRLAKPPIVLLNKSDRDSGSVSDECNLVYLGPEGKLVSIPAHRVSLIDEHKSSFLKTVLPEITGMLRRSVAVDDATGCVKDADSFIVSRHRHKVLLQECYSSLERFI